MKKFFGYVRVSTVRQGERGVSLQEQRDAITRYSQAQGIQISTWFEERETAARSGRPQFSEMVKLLRRGRAQGVVIHKIDRSARNLRDWANLGELLDKGVDVRFVNESLDMQSRGGRLSADIQAVVASDYIRNLKDEVRKGFYGRLRQGYYPMQAPVGYEDNGGGKPKTPHPVMGPLVREAFERYATGQHTLETLVEEMYQRGLRSRKEKRVPKNSMAKLLKNPFYMGLIRIEKTGETFSGVHEPLISKALFDRVQDVLHGKAVKGVKRHDFLFRKLLVCTSCGHRLVGERQKGHAYYRCHTKDCPTRCVREELVEEAVEHALKPLRFSSQELALMKDIALELKREWVDQRKSHLQELQMSHGALTDKIARLTDVYTEQQLDKALFDERMATLLAERRDVEEKMGELKANPDTGHEKLRQFLELAGSAYLSYKSAPHPLKREMIENVTSNRTVDGKNVSIKLNLPYSEVANRPSMASGGHHRGSPRTGQTRTRLKHFLIKLHELITRQEGPNFS